MVVFEQKLISRYFTSQEDSFSSPKAYVSGLLITGSYRKAGQVEN